MANLKKKKKERWFAPKSNLGTQEGRTVEKDTRYNSNRWRSTAKTVRYRDNHLCQECKRNGIIKEVGIRPNDHAVDHIKRVRDGGQFWELNNLELLCSSCHNSKSGREAYKREGEG